MFSLWCIYKGRGFDYVPSIDGKLSIREGGDVYFLASSTHSNHDACLTDSGASFHITPTESGFMNMKSITNVMTSCEIAR